MFLSLLPLITEEFLAHRRKHLLAGLELADHAIRQLLCGAGHVDGLKMACAATLQGRRTG